MLVSKNATIWVTPNANAKICVTPNTKPQRQSVEHKLRWSQTQKFYVGHVHFFFFGAHFICIGSSFSVEYGLNTFHRLYRIQNDSSQRTEPRCSDLVCRKSDKLIPCKPGREVDCRPGGATPI